MFLEYVFQVGRIPKNLTWLLALAFLLTCSLTVSAQPIQIVNLLELSGAGATVGIFGHFDG
jgi:hypothetical protein